MFIYLLTVILVLFYVWYRKKYSFWSSQNVPGPFPFPLVGTLPYLVIDETRLLDNRWYRKYGKIYGEYSGTTPNLVIADARLAKQILVTDFHIFNQSNKLFEHVEMLSSSILGLHGENWKRIRSTISPTFTTGKNRRTLSHLNRPMQNFLDNLEQLVRTKSDDKIQIRELTKGFALDTIANFVYSLEINSYQDKEHVFVRNMLRFAKINIYPFLMIQFVPSFLAKKLASLVIDQQASRNLVKFTGQVLQQRRQNADVKYNDFINLLLQSPNALSDLEITAQCALFFVAGLDTVSNGLTILLSDIAIHQDAQERLYTEIREKMNEEEITYEAIHKLEYLDAFVHESFRMTSVPTRLTRHCQTDYPLGDTGLTLKAGQSVMVSIYAIHHDQELFTDPFVFRPERYLPEHKDEPYNRFWFPFGDGPRNCVGIRFAMMEMKFFLINLIRNYHIRMANGCPVPVQYESKPFQMNPVDLRIRFTRRN